MTRHWGDDTPATDDSTVPVWIRDEWGVTEAKVREAATAAGNDSPTVFVLLPKIDAEAIADTLASYAAATDTVSQRPEPQTDEGRQAKQGMQSRVLEGHQRLESLFAAVIAKARVFQGGGNELTTSSLRDGVEAAGNHALARLFPKFPAADDPAWSKVITKARDGAPDALAVVGWQGEVPANPVCKEVLARTSGSGTMAYRAFNERSGMRFGQVQTRLTENADAAGVDNLFSYPHGLSTPAAQVAMIAKRYMHLSGATSRDFGAISVADRKHAAKNPKAYFYEKPITIEDHQNSRWIAEPLRLLDCCQETDGAVAIVVTSPARARDLNHRPAVIEAAAQGSSPDQYTMVS